MIKDYLDEKLHEECGVFGAVSYTHLDVYKRQVLDNQIHRLARMAGKLVQMRLCNGHDIHIVDDAAGQLDVYKRQEQHGLRAASGLQAAVLQRLSGLVVAKGKLLQPLLHLSLIHISSGASASQRSAILPCRTSPSAAQAPTTV